MRSCCKRQEEPTVAGCDKRAVRKGESVKCNRPVLFLQGENCVLGSLCKRVVLHTPKLGSSPKSWFNLFIGSSFINISGSPHQLLRSFTVDLELKFSV